MKGNELRQAYLQFFESKGHLKLDSFSLIPENDPSLLLIGAGMAPLKPFFTGKLVPPCHRITTSQKCMRTGDLENVGRTARHHTFFEMLGNFSFGDYFKKDAIHWAWEFLTEVIKLDKNRLYVTVYPDDQEAYDTWHNDCGVEESHITRLEDNFWEIGEGPCGPDSEIFFDQGPEHGCDDPNCAPGCDCDRYLEIWNLVFTQFNKMPDGSYEPLQHKNIDTGAGLERLASVLQHCKTNFETDLIFPIIEATAKRAGVKYNEDPNTDVSLKVIADHARAVTALISDGVLPSNEGRGYVLRRIIRRAVRHGHLLGAKEAFFYKLVPTLIEVMAEAGKEVKEKQANVEKLLRLEEEQFARTLERGLSLLDDALAQVKDGVLSGEVAFKLYDTYGFPLDLTADVCRERDIAIDEAGFEREMEVQRLRAQSASQFGMDYNNVIRVEGETKFEGYTESESLSKVTALFHDGKSVDSITAGQSAVVILENTPFYAESGGQIGDSGYLTSQGVQFNVKDTQKYGQVFGHIGELEQGSLKVGQTVNAVVDAARRHQTSLNHSATHLLHAALRQVLGHHVVQKGSLVSDTALRFDFAHPEAITKAQLNEIETLVNQKVRENYVVQTDIMDIEAAKAKGAMALFGEKYADVVRVLTMGDFSVELCGGIHAKRTGDIGLFKIVAETAVAAGIRRIEAVTGENAINWLHNQQRILTHSADLFKSDVNTLVEKIQQLQDKAKKAEKELQGLKEKAAMQAGSDLVKSAVKINDVSVIVHQLDGIETKSLRVMVDDLKNQLGSGVIVFASILDDKVNLVVGVTSDLTTKVKAGELVNLMAQQVGGKGGGRPDMAMAGGSQPENVNLALTVAQNWLSNNL